VRYVTSVPFWTQEVLLKGWCRGRIQVRAIVVSVWVGDYKMISYCGGELPCMGQFEHLYLPVCGVIIPREKWVKGHTCGESVFQMARVFWKLTLELNP